MTQHTLAQLVRAKYPGSYDDLSDQQLEASVRAKYPGTYDDLPLSGSQSAETPPPATKKFLGRTISPWGQATLDALPYLAGGAAALMTGGTSLPIQALAAAGAGAAGQAVKDLQQDMEPTERAANILLTVLREGATFRAGGLVVKAAPVLKGAARAWWQGAAKIQKPTAKSTQAMRMGGDLQAGKDEIAETVLSQGVGTIRRGHVQAMRDTLHTLDDELDEIVKSSNKFVKRQDLQNALLRQINNIGSGTQAQQHMQNALQKSFDLLEKEPLQMTVAKAQHMKREIYKFYQASFPAGAAESASAMADKTTGRALRGAITAAEPATAALNAEMSRLIPATKAMEEAVARISNHNLIGITGSIAAGTGSKLAFAAALINHPQFASFGAQRLYQAAKFLPDNSLTVANVLRVLEWQSSQAMSSHGGR